jgi:YVTN family beta-propeller protein
MRAFRTFVSLTVLGVLMTVALPHIPRAGDGTVLRTADMQVLKAGVGAKSIWISVDEERVYSINLETLSVQEFDREAKELVRQITFKPTPGTGYNYKERRPIKSLQEKPVEACFTHGGRYLWVSLHNAEGIVVWDLVETDTAVEGRPFKEIVLEDFREGTRTPGRLLWIKTGKTPKVLAATRDGRYLFVANWHSHTVSVIDVSSESPEGWTKMRDIEAGRIPRGMALSEDDRYLYVGAMGGSTIRVFDTHTLERVKDIPVDPNPRHLVILGGSLFVSINSGARVLKIDLGSDRVVAAADTDTTPRTIELSPDGRFVFVTCYYADTVQAFSSDDLTLVAEWDSSVHPVGIDLYQEGQLIEAWIANYTSGTVKVITLEETDPGLE